MITISITDKHANTVGAPVIVCGNSGYSITFEFDGEWDGIDIKTARFVYVRDGALQYEDVIFSGDTVDVPVLANIKEVFVGVYAGDLQTTTPARIPCEASIRCGTGAPAEPTPDQYDQIMALLADCVVKDGDKELSDNNYTDAEKTKLAGIAAGANKYTLPAASTAAIGGVQIASDMQVSNGLLSLIEERAVTFYTLALYLSRVLIKKGTADPTTATYSDFVGQHYINTTTSAVFIATGANTWVKLT